MKLLLVREFDNEKSTVGKLFYIDESDQLRYCNTIEDEYRDVLDGKKIYGESRIPSNSYNIKMRKIGGIYNRYLLHKNEQVRDLTEKYGIPWIQDVPYFEYILIHIGNTEKDSKGCILVGNGVTNNSEENGFIYNSTGAYIELMKAIGFRLDKDENIEITIIDFDRIIRDMTEWLE